MKWKIKNKKLHSAATYSDRNAFLGTIITIEIEWNECKPSEPGCLRIWVTHGDGGGNGGRNAAERSLEIHLDPFRRQNPK